MARPAIDDDNEDKPLDPAVEKVRRKLVRFVAINLGLLFVALMAVVIALVYKTRNEPEVAVQPPVTDIPAPGGLPAEVAVPLPAGSRLVGHALSGDRVTLDIEAADGSRSIVVYDIAQRRIVARLALTPQ